MNTDKIYAEQIANEYAPKQTSKVKALKKLDAKAKAPANIFTYTFGIASSLILGTGMSFAMGVIGTGTPPHNGFRYPYRLRRYLGRKRQLLLV